MSCLKRSCDLSQNTLPGEQIGISENKLPNRAEISIDTELEPLHLLCVMMQKVFVEGKPAIMSLEESLSPKVSPLGFEEMSGRSSVGWRARVFNLFLPTAKY